MAWQLEQRDKEVAALRQQLSFLQQEVRGAAPPCAALPSHTSAVLQVVAQLASRSGSHTRQGVLISPEECTEPVVMLSAALQVDATKQSGGERDSRLRAAEASASGAAEELRKKEAHIAQLQAENEVMQRDRCGRVSAHQLYILLIGPAFS